MAYHGINQNTRKTHCKRGHEFTRENTRVVKNGRACIACQKLYYLEHRTPLGPIDTPEARFWAGVNKAQGLGPRGDCWEWQRACFETGYGQTKYKGRQTSAHRAAYQYTHGDLPPGRQHQILHSCDNRKCVNPAHLRHGTHKQNMEDMMNRGRHYSVSITHCKRGHELAGENLMTWAGTTRRVCRECSRIRDAERAAKEARRIWRQENHKLRSEEINSKRRDKFKSLPRERRDSINARQREYYQQNREKLRGYYNNYRKQGNN